MHRVILLRGRGQAVQILAAIGGGDMMPRRRRVK